MSKIIPFFSNSDDNFHCLQSCMKSILAFYFPDREFTNKEIDERTLQEGGWTWLPPAANWLSELGLNVKLYSPFNYEEFSKRGIEYMREFKGEEASSVEEINGSYKNLPFIQQQSLEMAGNNLWTNEVLSIENLEVELEHDDTLAIGKTIYEWLNGSSVGTTSHYVLIIKKYAQGVWRVHDPGLPGVENRKISQKINGDSIFPETLLIKNKMIEIIYFIFCWS